MTSRERGSSGEDFPDLDLVGTDGLLDEILSSCQTDDVKSISSLVFANEVCFLGVILYFVMKPSSMKKDTTNHGLCETDRISTICGTKVSKMFHCMF